MSEDMTEKSSLDVPGGEKRVLLHTCCAPCSSAIVEYLMKNGVIPVIYYCNPNIYPEKEYLVRKDECTRYALSLGLEIVDDDYDHSAWLDRMRGLEDEPERGSRCLSDYHDPCLFQVEKPGADKPGRKIRRIPLPGCRLVGP